MGSLYLNRLSHDAYQHLIQTLWDTQHGYCFICETPIDLTLHADSIDIDHIIPLNAGGRDDTINFALTHAHCNRSKQASDLRIARILARFQRLQDECPQLGHPNLTDILQAHSIPHFELPIQIKQNLVNYSFPDLGRNVVLSTALYHDQLSHMNYFFAVIPISYLTHDERINPRAIAGASLRRLIEEFNASLPQLHTALAWTTITEGQMRASIHVFDGQHKAAAQILLGTTELPLRIFVNPDMDRLLTANTHAGTTLRQVAFDKSIQRSLGSQLFADRIEGYLTDLGLSLDYRGFSEKDLVDHFKGQWREIRRYILDDVRDSITHHPDNRLKSFIDFGGRGSALPLSYSTVEKTFYSFFIYQGILATPLDYRLEQGENPRELEKEQILRLMNIIANQIYLGNFDPATGTNRLESRVQQGQSIPPGHLRAYRMSKEEILYNWLNRVGLVIKNFFLINGTPFDEDRLFQYRFPEPLWERIKRFVENLSGLPLWVNTSLSSTVFGGKQTYDYWRIIFETGRTPSNQIVMAEPINVMKLIE